MSHAVGVGSGSPLGRLDLHSVARTAVGNALTTRGSSPLNWGLIDAIVNPRVFPGHTGRRVRRSFPATPPRRVYPREIFCPRTENQVVSSKCFYFSRTACTFLAFSGRTPAAKAGPLWVHPWIVDPTRAAPSPVGKRVPNCGNFTRLWSAVPRHAGPGISAHVARRDFHGMSVQHFQGMSGSQFREARTTHGYRGPLSTGEGDIVPVGPRPEGVCPAKDSRGTCCFRSGPEG